MANKPNRVERMVAKCLVVMKGWTWMVLLLELGKKVLCCPPDQRHDLLTTALDATKDFEQVDLDES